jgi:hypothetical protein
MPVLTAKSPHFTSGHSINANFLQGVLHFIQFGKFDGGFDLFHGLTPSNDDASTSKPGPTAAQHLIYQGNLAINDIGRGAMFSRYHCFFLPSQKGFSQTCLPQELGRELGHVRVSGKFRSSH